MKIKERKITLSKRIQEKIVKVNWADSKPVKIPACLSSIAKLLKDLLWYGWIQIISITQIIL